MSAWLQNFKQLSYKSDDSKAKRSLSKWLPSETFPFYESLMKRLCMWLTRTLLGYFSVFVATFSCTHVYQP